MQRALAVVVLVLATVAAALGHWFALLFHVVGTCGVSDTGGEFPAAASWQGALCSSRDGWTELVPVYAFAGSAVLSVVLFVLLWWHSDHLRRVSWLPLVACPAVTLAVLALPPDTCSDEARRSHPAYDCRTTPD